SPFFAWVHYWDAHMPYAPPEPYASMYYRGDPRDARHTSLLGARYGWELLDVGQLRRGLSRQAESVRGLKRDYGLSGHRVRELVLAPQDAPGGPEETARMAALASAVR